MADRDAPTFAMILAQSPATLTGAGLDRQFLRPVDLTALKQEAAAALADADNAQAEGGRRGLRFSTVQLDEQPPASSWPALATSPTGGGNSGALQPQPPPGAAPGASPGVALRSALRTSATGDLGLERKGTGTLGEPTIGPNGTLRMPSVASSPSLASMQNGAGAPGSAASLMRLASSSNLEGGGGPTLSHSKSRLRISSSGAPDVSLGDLSRLAPPGAQTSSEGGVNGAGATSALSAPPLPSIPSGRLPSPLTSSRHHSHRSGSSTTTASSDGLTRGLSLPRDALPGAPRPGTVTSPPVLLREEDEEAQGRGSGGDGGVLRLQPQAAARQPAPPRGVQEEEEASVAPPASGGTVEAAAEWLHEQEALEEAIAGPATAASGDDGEVVGLEQQSDLVDLEDAERLLAAEQTGSQQVDA